MRTGVVFIHWAEIRVPSFAWVKQCEPVGFPTFSFVQIPPVQSPPVQSPPVSSPPARVSNSRPDGRPSIRNEQASHLRVVIVEGDVQSRPAGDVACVDVGSVGK